MNKKVSIIVPCYNREKYIRECVDSLLMQTFPMDDMELIFVDDASTDATVDILKEYEAVWSENIIIITNEKNSGTAGAMRNIGMQYASGDYIMFVDSDDWVEESIVEALHSLILERDSDIVAASLDWYNEQGNVAAGSIYADRSYNLEATSDFQQLLDSDTVKNGTVCGKLYRKSFLDEKGLLFSEDIRIGEDQLFTVQCIFSASVYITSPKVMYHYRSNSSGFMQGLENADYYLGVFEVQERLYPLYLTKWDDIHEIVEYYFYRAVLMIRERYMLTDESDKYYGRLEYMRETMRELVPDAKDNPHILAQEGTDADALYAELFENSLN